MQETSIKEFTSFKEIGLLKTAVTTFTESVDTLVSIKESNTEIEICAKSFAVYLLLDNSKGADILQIPLTRIKCYKVIFLFHDKNFFCQKQISFGKLEDFLISFSDSELIEISNSMPLVGIYVNLLRGSCLGDFALIWRDHFLEENIPLLRGFEELGIKPEWIFTLAKGDKTIKCKRIAAHFREHGYFGVETLPNLLRDSEDEKRLSDIVIHKLERFILKAKDHHKKIMIVDDGGIITNYFHKQQSRFSCAIEVTIVGIKKLQKLEKLDIPIYDLGMSELKKLITYPEIAESCVKRIKELMPGEKIIGRHILILGYGTAGKHVARIFRNMGALVGVIDIDALKLIEAAEHGFITFKTSVEGIAAINPFLIVGCTGAVSLDYHDFKLLKNGSYVTGIATKDLESLRDFPDFYSTEWLPETGYIHRISHDRHFVQLGDGQSINLYESEAIPNRANDIFKTGILIAASELSNSYHTLKGGIYLDRVNKIIKNSRLYEAYYDLYFLNHG